MGFFLEKKIEALLETNSLGFSEDNIQQYIIERSKDEGLELDRHVQEKEYAPGMEEGDFDPVLSGKKWINGVKLKYFWEIDTVTVDGDNEKKLTRTFWVENKIFTYLLVSILCAAISYLLYTYLVYTTSAWNFVEIIMNGTYSVGGNPDPSNSSSNIPTYALFETVGALFTGILFMLSMAIASGALTKISQAPNIVPDLKHNFRSYDSHRPFDIVKITLFLSYLASLFVFFFPSVFLTGLLFLLYITLFTILFKEWRKINREFHHTGVLFDDKINLLLSKINVISKSSAKRKDMQIFAPHVVGEYGMYTAPLAFPAFYLTLLPEFGGLFGIILGGWISVPLTVVVLSWDLSDISDSVHRLTQSIDNDTRREARRSVQLFWFGVVSLISACFVGLYGLFYWQWRPLIMPPLENPYSTFLFITTTIPLLYFIIGFLFQIYMWIKQKYEFIGCTSSLSVKYNTSASVLELETDELSAKAVSTGFNNYILIPSSILRGENSLNEEEISAIIAHEESHIKNKESLLTFYVPILSPIVFLGQNVIYGLLNFPLREHQADLYAKNQVGKDALISSLEKLKMMNKSRTDSDTQDSPEFGESTGSNDTENGSILRDYYYLFFSTFAHSKAHPSVDDRKEYLDKHSEE